MNKNDITIKGEHNLSNVLSALLIGVLSDIAPQKMGQIVHNFKGAKHRLEYVTEIDGVTFIDDSKATNISSAIVAMNAINDPTTIILGGSDKGYDFDELFEKMPANIKNIIILGETKQKLLESADKFNKQNVYDVDSMADAVFLAFELSLRGETVLLSPACASFDMFSNYEERGKVFSKLALKLK